MITIEKIHKNTTINISPLIICIQWCISKNSLSICFCISVSVSVSLSLYNKNWNATCYWIKGINWINMGCWVVWSGCCHSLSSCHWTLSCSKTQQYFQTFSICIALILRVNYRTGDSASYVWRVAELSWSLIARSKGYFPFPHPLPVKSSLSRDQTMIPPSPFDLAKSTCEWNDWLIDWLIDFSLESLINVEINKELLYDLRLYVDYLHLPFGPCNWF